MKLIFKSHNNNKKQKDSSITKRSISIFNCQIYATNLRVFKASQDSPIREGSVSNYMQLKSLVQHLTIQNVGSIEGLLLLLQDAEVEGCPVSHFIVIIHHTPEIKLESFAA